jgi:fructose-1,6-bisphosphatase II / sedoheptulose-1,7-bisphosphatase
LAQAVRFARSAPALDRILTLELARVTERTAVAAARFRGRGDEQAADQAAVEAMRSELDRLPIDAAVVLGEGERDETPMLYVGETVGKRGSAKVDLAVDPLDGATICAKNGLNALAVLAVAEKGGLFNAPDVYMEKIAIGPGYPQGIVDLDASPADNVKALARAKGVDVGKIAACVLERPRHARLIEALRAAGASVRLIGDGDVAGVIDTTRPEATGVDIYLGIGGAPEGVLAAAALSCIGGQMQGRLVFDSETSREGARRMGHTDLNRKLDLADLARGDVLFAATGVTDGNLLNGVRFTEKAIVTHSVVMRASSGTVRWIQAEHRDFDKFDDAV